MNVHIKWFTVLLCACLLTGMGTWYWTNGTRFGHTQPELKANVFVLHEGIGGTEEVAGANIITNIGERYVRNQLAFANETSGVANTTTCIAVGNYSAVAATDTELNDETTTGGFVRANGTTTAWYNTTANNFAFNVSKTFTATAITIINCTGLFWSTGAAAANTMFAEAAITQTTFQINDNCTITWCITVAKS